MNLPIVIVAVFIAAFIVLAIGYDERFFVRLWQAVVIAIMAVLLMKLPDALFVVPDTSTKDVRPVIMKPERIEI
jgi:hypothetical protein